MSYRYQSLFLFLFSFSFQPCKQAATAPAFYSCKNLKLEASMFRSHRLHDQDRRRLRVHRGRNRARIKTWQGGRGFARSIVFQDMVMDGTEPDHHQESMPHSVYISLLDGYWLLQTVRGYISSWWDINSVNMTLTN
jgi:hypothetical protein